MRDSSSYPGAVTSERLHPDSVYSDSDEDGSIYD
jgi:hypothetical protein